LTAVAVVLVFGDATAVVGVGAGVLVGLNVGVLVARTR
jgi:hypothetical protein